jgi:2',5'-phosphodiesterase
MAGYPVMPVAALAFADKDFCKWRWLRKPHAAGKGGSSSSSSSKDKAAAAAAEWEDTGCSSICYTPTQEDIGYTLRVECTPAAAAGNADVQQQQGGEISLPSSSLVLAAAVVTAAADPQQQQSLNASSRASNTAAVVYGEPLTADTGPVRAGPEQPAARLRQLNPGVALPEPWRFRVMSYNILADQYAGTSYAQQVLFKYCPTELLDNNYRRQLVLEEAQRYQVRKSVVLSFFSSKLFFSSGWLTSAT